LCKKGSGKANAEREQEIFFHSKKLKVDGLRNLEQRPGIFAATGNRVSRPNVSDSFFVEGCQLFTLM
jgi:hypothetical protein